MKYKTKKSLENISIWILIIVMTVFTISLIPFSGIYDTVKEYSMMSIADIELWVFFIIVMMYRLVFGRS